MNDKSKIAVIRDKYPVSRGHTLVLPKKHKQYLTDLTPYEYRELWLNIKKVIILLKKEYMADGFNIGINDGAAAGQTIGHLHVHIIPRYKGDVRDPRGGVRWILPKKANYWTIKK